MVGRNLMDNTGISMSMSAREDMWPGQGPTELLIYMNYRNGAFRKDFPSYKTKVRNTVPTSQLTSKLIAKGVLGSKLDEQIRLHSARHMNWAVDFEMLPLPQNRVTPSRTKTDALGLPVPSIYYSVDDYWNAGRDFAVKDLQRMAGFLNADIAATDVAGCSVMPAVGCVNPTLTGAALSIRVADTLLKEI